MLRVPLAKAYIKRTLRVNYGWTQTTPKDMYLDPAWDRSTPIWPGMVMMHTGNEAVSLINSTGRPLGLSALYIGGDGIDEVLDSGINSTTVWVLERDAEFEVLAPAFDASLSYSVALDGTDTFLYARTANVGSVTATTVSGLRGQLCPAGTSGATTAPVCTLLKVVSPNKIIVGGIPSAPRT